MSKKEIWLTIAVSAITTILIEILTGWPPVIP